MHMPGLVCRDKRSAKMREAVQFPFGETEEPDSALVHQPAGGVLSDIM